MLEEKISLAEPEESRELDVASVRVAVLRNNLELQADMFTCDYVQSANGYVLTTIRLSMTSISS